MGTENLLPNPSFEQGWYHQNGIPELQLPNGWRLDYDQGATGYGGEKWDVWVRPETRVLSRAFLPESEHGLYINLHAPDENIAVTDYIRGIKYAATIMEEYARQLTRQQG